jgi:hypothetical protein
MNGKNFHLISGGLKAFLGFNLIGEVSLKDSAQLLVPCLLPCKFGDYCKIGVNREPLFLILLRFQG